MRSVLILGILLKSVAGSCPDGFDLVNDECRGLKATLALTTQKAVDVAQDECFDILTKPIIIHNEEDNTYWSSKVDPNLDSGANQQVWVLGLVCNSKLSKWEWSDGSNVNYVPPDNDIKSENCTIGFSWILRHDGKWTIWNSLQELTTHIFCSAPNRQPIPSPDGCDSFDADNDDGVCYMVGEQAESWNEAQLNCKELGANLASIHNDQENSFIRRLAVSKGAVNGLFLGGTITGKDDKFGWIDGSEWDYDNFYPGFPLPGIGDCLAMDTSISTGQWMNKNCSAKLPVACSRDQKLIPDPTCATGLTPMNTIFTSPGYPYSASMPCDFFLEVAEGKTVLLEFLVFEANPCCDGVELRDDFVGGNIITSMAGDGYHMFFRSPTNLMRVSWKPNGGVNVRGLSMIYTGV